MPKTKTTALFTLNDYLSHFVNLTAWKNASGKRVEIIDPGYMYDKDDDEYEGTQEYQVIFSDESAQPWTVDRDELSDIKTEDVVE